MSEAGRDGAWIDATRADVPVPDAPQTIRQNWIPFLTFFFLRILIWMAQTSATRILYVGRERAPGGEQG